MKIKDDQGQDKSANIEDRDKATAKGGFVGALVMTHRRIVRSFDEIES
ncbi:hypothetical protein HanIR_Chr03g0136261 [Helianthus annuus]|nr:hypothetical protein HanIR_Chr03g0136261 [Helianthus annuus]